MAKRKTTKQAPKQTQKPKRGPLPLLPVDLAGCRLHLPLETLRDPVLCPPGSEQQKLLLNALIDSHNEHHSPMIRQAEAQQASRRRGTKKSTTVRKVKATDRGAELAALVARCRTRKQAWAQAVELGLAKTPEAAERAFYRHAKQARRSSS
jgi:hypothetical protein